MLLQIGIYMRAELFGGPKDGATHDFARDQTVFEVHSLGPFADVGVYLVHTYSQIAGRWLYCGAGACWQHEE